ncbi:trehalase-like domain-containing protein [Streptomyces sp. NPDC054933]
MTARTADLELPALLPHPLRQEAPLADGERGVLVGPRGDFAWMCAPRRDSDAVFSSLIGGRSSYAITPLGRYVWGGYYEKGSLIWRSRWVIEDGIVECRESLAFPGDPHRAIALRRVTARDARAQLTVFLAPRASFDVDPLESSTQEAAGVWTGRTSGLRPRWSGCRQARPSVRTDTDWQRN